MGEAILPDLETEILIPIYAVVGIAFSLFQWVLVSRVKVSPEKQSPAANNKNGFSELLIEEEEGINDHNVVLKYAEIQSAISEEISTRRYNDDIGCSGLTASGGETAEQVADDVVYVAVGKKINESKSTLLYVLRNWKGRKMCILYIHKPSKRINPTQEQPPGLL